MSFPSIRPNITSNQHLSANSNSLNVLQSFFLKHSNHSIYTDSDSKSIKMIEVIEPELNSYPSTKKIKPNIEIISSSADTPARSDLRSKDSITLCYSESEKKIPRTSGFTPSITRQVTLEIVSDEESEKQDNSCMIVDGPVAYSEKQSSQIPVGIESTLLIDDDSGQENQENVILTQFLPGSQRAIVEQRNVESPVRSQASGSSPFYSPTSHEFLGEFYGDDGEKLAFSRSCSLNAKRLFQFREDIDPIKEEHEGKITFERGDTIIISDSEDNEGVLGLDNEQTRCTVMDVENRNTNVNALDSKVDKIPEESAKSPDTVLNPVTPEETKIEIKIKPEETKKETKRKPGRPKKSTGEPTKKQKESNPPAKKPKKAREVQKLTEDTTSYWKGGRGLNKLQVLRYQMDVINEEEAIEKIEFFEKDAKEEATTKSNSEEEMKPQEAPVNYDPAAIPPLDRRQNDKKRTPLVPKWNPDSITEEELKSFIEKLKTAIKETLIDDERLVGVLKKFDCNTKLALEDIKKNSKYYKGVVTQRFRRSTRRVQLG